MDGEIFIHAAQPGNEMIFEGADCLLGGIASVEVWQDQLEVDAFMMKVLLECAGGFIVKALELWLQSSCTELCMPHFIGIKNQIRLLVFEGDSKDGIAIIIIDDQDVIIAIAGGCHKFSCQIHVHLPHGLHEHSVTSMGVGVPLGMAPGKVLASVSAGVTFGLVDCKFCCS